MRKIQISFDNMFYETIVLDSKVNGRFLRRVDSSREEWAWEVVSDDVARHKVSHAFRSHYRRALSVSEESSTSGSKGA